MTLTFKAIDQTLVPIPTNAVPRDGSRKYLFLEFDLNGIGEEFTVTAYLHRDEDDEGYAEIYEGNPLEVPPYFTQSSGFLLHLGFVSGDTSYTTNDVAVSLNAASKKWTSIPPSVDIPAYQQLVQKAEEARKAAEDAKDAAKEASKRTGLPVAVGAAGAQVGVHYEAFGEDLPELEIGRQVVLIPMDTNAEEEIYLALNDGADHPIRLRAAEAEEGGDGTKTVPVGALVQNVPYTLTFAGDCWLVDSIALSVDENGMANFYAQDDEPINAPDGSFWLDTDEESNGGNGGMPSGDFVTKKELKEAVDEALSDGVDAIVDAAVQETVKGITIEETDPTVPDWAKEPQPPKLSQLVNDAGFVTAADLPSGGGDKPMTLIYEKTFEQVNKVTDTCEELKDYKKLIWELKVFDRTENIQLYYFQLGEQGNTLYGTPFKNSPNYPYHYAIGEIEENNGLIYKKSYIGNPASDFTNTTVGGGATSTSQVCSPYVANRNNNISIIFMGENTASVRLRIWGC